MKKKTRPIVPNKAKRMVREYERLGYILTPWRDKCLIRMVFPTGESNVNVFHLPPSPVFILSYTTDGKVHPLAGMSLLNRQE